MKTKDFKVGDKVVCTGNVHTMVIRDGIHNGSKHEITGVGGWYSGRMVQIDGNTWRHSPDKFELDVEAVIIVLRRLEDLSGIEKFLKSKGYEWYSEHSERSRIIVVHFSERIVGEKTMSYLATVKYRDSVKDSVKHTKDFWKARGGYENMVVIKTKPSVRKAIVELKKYI